MSLQSLQRGGMLGRVRLWLGRGGAEHNVRDSIAELVQQSADQVSSAGRFLRHPLVTFPQSDSFDGRLDRAIRHYIVKP